MRRLALPCGGKYLNYLDSTLNLLGTTFDHLDCLDRVLCYAVLGGAGGLGFGLGWHFFSYSGEVEGRLQGSSSAQEVCTGATNRTGPFQSHTLLVLGSLRALSRWEMGGGRSWQVGDGESPDGQHQAPPEESEWVQYCRL